MYKRTPGVEDVSCPGTGGRSLTPVKQCDILSLGGGEDVSRGLRNGWFEVDRAVVAGEGNLAAPRTVSCIVGQSSKSHLGKLSGRHT